MLSLRPLRSFAALPLLASTSNPWITLRHRCIYSNLSPLVQWYAPCPLLNLLLRVFMYKFLSFCKDTAHWIRLCPIVIQCDPTFAWQITSAKALFSKKVVFWGSRWIQPSIDMIFVFYVSFGKKNKLLRRHFQYSNLWCFLQLNSWKEACVVSSQSTWVFLLNLNWNISHYFEEIEQ